MQNENQEEKNSGNNQFSENEKSGLKFRILKKFSLTIYLFIWLGIGFFIGYMANFLSLSAYKVNFWMNACLYLFTGVIIAFYIFNFRRENLQKMSKIITAGFILVIIWSAFLLNFLLVPDFLNFSLAAILNLLPILFLAPAIYVLLRYSFEKSWPVRKVNRKLFGKALIIPLTCWLIALLPLPQDQVKVKKDYVKILKKKIVPENADPNDNAEPYYEKAFAKLTDINSLPHVSSLFDANSIELNKAKEIINSNEQTIDYLKKASQQPYYWNKDYTLNFFDMVESSNLSNLSKFRKGAKILSYKSQLLAINNDLDKSIDLIFKMKRIGYHLKGPRSIVEQLVGIAINAKAEKNIKRLIFYKDLPRDKLTEIRAELENPNLKKPQIDLTFEKFLYYDFIQNCYTDNGRGNGNFSPAGMYRYMSEVQNMPVPPIKATFINLPFKRENAIKGFEKVYDYYKKIAEFTPAELKERDIELKENDPETFAEMMTYLMVSPYDSMHCMDYEIKSRKQALDTILALHIYKKQFGNLPETLHPLLEKGLLDKKPMDPYNKQGLTYKKTDDSFILYSYASDFDDDGGKHDSWNTKDGDYVLWPITSDKCNKKRVHH